ncbi:MAG: hypothetical protein WBF04_06990 [Candidatus Sulfotelmatobacter sp.]
MTRKPKPKAPKLADVTFTDASGRARRRYTVRSDRIQSGYARALLDEPTEVALFGLWDRGAEEWLYVNEESGWNGKTFPTRADALLYLRTTTVEDREYRLEMLENALYRPA